MVVKLILKKRLNERILRTQNLCYYRQLTIAVNSMHTVQIQLGCHQCGIPSESVQFTGLFLNTGFWGGLFNESQPQNPEYGWDIGNIMFSIIYFDHSRLIILMSCTLTKIWIFKSSGFFNFHPCFWRVSFPNRVWLYMYAMYVYGQPLYVKKRGWQTVALHENS